MTKKTKAQKLLERNDKRLQATKDARIMRYAHTMLASINYAIGVLTDSGATEEERKRMIGVLRAVEWNATSEGRHSPPELFIVCKDGFVNAIVSDLPEVVAQMMGPISVIDYDSEDDEPDEMTASILQPNGKIVDAMVYFPPIERSGISILDSNIAAGDLDDCR